MNILSLLRHYNNYYQFYFFRLTSNFIFYRPFLIHFKKFINLHDTIVDFLEPQQYTCELVPNHDLQWAIGYRMSCCGRVTSTGATVAERSNMAQRKKVAEQIETEAVAKKLSYLGF